MIRYFDNFEYVIDLSTAKVAVFASRGKTGKGYSVWVGNDGPASITPVSYVRLFEIDKLAQNNEKIIFYKLFCISCYIPAIVSVFELSQNCVKDDVDNTIESLRQLTLMAKERYEALREVFDE